MDANTAEKPMFSRRQLFSLLWPLLVEQLLTVLVGMIDVLMVTAVGETAVSGVSLVDSVNHLLIQVLFALCTGGTVVCAGFIGKKDDENAGKSTAQMIVITFFFMLVIAVLLLFGRKALLGLIFGRVEPAVMENAVKYMFFTLFSLPFLALYQSGSAAFRSSGNTRVPMFVSLGMNALNIAGNAVCIFGLHMGVVGVALPTLIARAAAAVTVLMLLQRSSGPVRIRSLRQFRPDGAIIRRMLSIGIPNSVESSLFNVGKILLQSLVSTLGTPSIAGFAVAGNLATYLYLPGNACGAAMTTVVSQCVGAGKPEQARSYAKKLILLNYIFLIFICAAMIAFRGFWVGCYRLSDLSSYYAQNLILSHSLAMILWPVGFLFPYYFRATGRAVFTMAVSLITMAACRIALAYLFVKGFHQDVLWIWYAMYADWIVRVIVYLTAFKKDRLKDRRT